MEGIHVLSACENHPVHARDQIGGSLGRGGRSNDWYEACVFHCCQVCRTETHDRRVVAPGRGGHSNDGPG